MLEVNRLILTVSEDAPKPIDQALCIQPRGQTPLDIRILRFLMDTLGVTILVKPPIYACLDDNMEVWKEAEVALVPPWRTAMDWGARPMGFRGQYSI